MKRVLFAVIALAIILASCEAPPGPEGYDWCYTYNFADSADGINIQDGLWVDTVGIATDESGLLRINWTHDRTVIPALLVFTVARLEGVDGDIPVLANGIIFDVGASIDQTFPADSDEVVIYFEPDTTVSGSRDANLTIDAAAPLVLESVEVRGQGFSPFDTNECGPPTWTPAPTETIITPTPTATNTPLFTDTPTNTFTPSPTFTATPDGWSQTFNFNVNDGGFTAGTAAECPTPPTWSAVYHAGSGWGTMSSSEVFCIERTWTMCPTTAVTHIGMNWSNFQSAVGYDGGSITGYTNSTVEQTFFDGDMHMVDGAGGTFAGEPTLNRVTLVGNVPVPGYTSFRITAVTIQGTGDNPFLGCSTPTPTISPTPSVTLTPSRTPLASHTPFSGTATRTPIRFASGTPLATNTLAPSPTPPSHTPPATRTNIPPPTGFMTSTPAPTPTGTLIPGAGDDDTETNDLLTGIGELLTSILNGIGDFFTWVQNTALNFFDWLGQIFAWVGSALYNVLTIVGNFFGSISAIIQGILDFFRLIVDIIRLLLEIIIRLVTLFAEWISTLATMISNIINQFFTAPATAIPGLPQCASNPTAHDICAIYYMVDYTLLSPGTMGQYIIPTALLNLDLWMVFFLARFVLKLLKIGRETTNV